MSSFNVVMEERKKLVNQIIENMKQGYVMPKPDWNRGFFRSRHIQNPVSSVRYHGANFVKLYLIGEEQGYNDGRWMTYKQAQSMGWQVKRGEQGVRLEKYIFDKTVEQKNPNTGEMEKVRVPLDRPMVNTFVVFHASQIEGIPEPEQLPELEHDEILQIAEDIIASSECPIIETDEGEAYYSPSKDKIVLPNRNAFLDQTSFLATQLHEMVHSTGHKTRLNRNQTGRFGSPEYAMEELRAELGSFFIQTDLGISLDAQHYNSHTHYLKSWIEALENAPNELFRAISDAQKASDYLESRYKLYLEQKQFLEHEEISKGDNIMKIEMSETGHPVDMNMSMEELDRANELVEAYRQDADNYYKVVHSSYPDYPFNVQVITDGYYSGNGKFCKDIDAVKDFVEKWEAERTIDWRMKNFVSECRSYPSDLHTDETAVIRLAVKMELKADGRGCQHLKDWITIRQNREIPLEPERAEQLWDAFHLAMDIARYPEVTPEAAMSEIEKYEKITGETYSDVKETIKNIYGFQEGKGFQFNRNCTEKVTPVPMKSCSR